LDLIFFTKDSGSFQACSKANEGYQRSIKLLDLSSPFFYPLGFKGGITETVDTLTLLGTAWALAMDAFAVSAAVAASLPKMTARHNFRLAWHFGLFQAGMPVLGWFGGTALSSLMASLDHWIAFGLLVFLGLRMIWESRHPQTRGEDYDPTRGWTLVSLSFATSIDALAVGVSLGLIGVSIWVPSVVIGIVALILTLVGSLVGRSAGPYLGQWAEGVGGVVLIAIGTRILFQHLTGFGV
jgi:putative Mn2+ efflux pump MntP